MNNIFARTYEDALLYLKSTYGFDGDFSNGIVSDDDNDNLDLGVTNDHTFEHKSTHCSCGETDGVWVYDNDNQKVEVVVICDTCYSDSEFRDQV